MEGKMAGKEIPRMKDVVSPMRSGQSVFDFDDGSLGEAGKALLVLDMRSEARQYVYVHEILYTLKYVV